MPTISAFDNIGNKHILYPAEDCEIILYFFQRTCYKCNWFWKEKNATVNKKELKLHQDMTACYIWGKRFSKKFVKDQNYQKFINHCHFTGNYSQTSQTISHTMVIILS